MRDWNVFLVLMLGKRRVNFLTEWKKIRNNKTEEQI